MDFLSYLESSKIFHLFFYFMKKIGENYSMRITRSIPGCFFELFYFNLN